MTVTWPLVVGLAVCCVSAALLFVQVRRMSWMWDHQDELTPVQRARGFGGLFRRIGYFQITMGATLVLPAQLRENAAWVSSFGLFAVSACMMTVGIVYHQGPIARRVVPFVPILKQLVYVANMNRYDTPWPPQEKRKPNVRRA